MLEPLASSHDGDSWREDARSPCSPTSGWRNRSRHDDPHELSGGQRQRVDVARALVTHPAFIVFDEAVSALDVSVQAQILNLIRDLQKEHSFSSLFISHDLAAVRYVAHRLRSCGRGEIVELAHTAVFYESPAHPYSQKLFQELTS